MKSKLFKFANSATQILFAGKYSDLKKLVDKSTSVLITDENVYEAHANKFKGWNTIVLKAGEEFKNQSTVDSVIEQLIGFETDRKWNLVGVGGGVITDLTGYIASIYMRGIRFGFIPTSILSLVDASIGGKNGIDVGDYKNMVGVIRQPSFILHDLDFLRTLPQNEWENGFAEIIKHGWIRDAAMFRILENASLNYFQKNKQALSELISRNVLLKIKLVQKDEFEKGERRLLNFGHSLGHALETQYELMHGQAVAIGMVAACRISEKLTGFDQTKRLADVLEKYGLPAYASFDAARVFNIMKMDKKREKKTMDYVMLDKIGKGVYQQIAFTQLEKYIRELS